MREFSFTSGYMTNWKRRAGLLDCTAHLNSNVQNKKWRPRCSWKNVTVVGLCVYLSAAQRCDSVIGFLGRGWFVVGVLGGHFEKHDGVKCWVQCKILVCVKEAHQHWLYGNGLPIYITREVGECALRVIFTLRWPRQVAPAKTAGMPNRWK